MKEKLIQEAMDKIFPAGNMTNPSKIDIEFGLKHLAETYENEILKILEDIKENYCDAFGEQCTVNKIKERLCE